MAGGNAIRGTRVGAGPMGESERGETAPRARVAYHCSNGHLFGPNQVLVGYGACLGHGGRHTSWHWRTCDPVVYAPPLNIHCTALEGPAAVRISNRTA